MLQALVLLLLLPFAFLFAVMKLLMTSLHEDLKEHFNVPLLLLSISLLYFSSVAYANQNPDPKLLFTTLLESFGTMTVAGLPISGVLLVLGSIAFAASIVFRFRQIAKDSQA